MRFHPDKFIEYSHLDCASAESLYIYLDVSYIHFEGIPFLFISGRLKEEKRKRAGNEGKSPRICSADSLFTDVPARCELKMHMLFRSFSHFCFENLAFEINEQWNCVCIY